MGNVGSLMTPTLLHTGNTLTENENACIQATYNIDQKRRNLWAGEDEDNPNARFRASDWNEFWYIPSNESGNTIAAFHRMQKSVLSAYFVNSGSSIKIWGYSSGTTVSGVHALIAQRPTWAVIHQ